MSRRVGASSSRGIRRIPGTDRPPATTYLHMVHDEWWEAISAAADEQLDGAEANALDAHLQTCPDCTDLLHTFERDRRRLRLHPVQATDGLADRVLAARRLTAGGSPSTDQPGTDRPTTDQPITAARRTLVRRGGLVLGAVAAAMIVVVSLTRPPADPVAPAPDLAHDHALIDAGRRTFDRAEVQVPAGTTVEWRNAGATTHHLVRSLGGATVTEALRPGQTEFATFSAPGTYRFFCSIHPEMTGSVTVDA